MRDEWREILVIDESAKLGCGEDWGTNEMWFFQVEIFDYGRS